MRADERSDPGTEDPAAFDGGEPATDRPAAAPGALTPPSANYGQSPSGESPYSSSENTGSSTNS
jgi:hypothetical protein